MTNYANNFSDGTLVRPVLAGASMVGSKANAAGRVPAAFLLWRC
jgi:hypothetical protein